MKRENMFKPGTLPPTDGLDITVDRGEEAATVRLHGRLGIDSSPELRDQLLAILQAQPPKTVVVDLTELSYIDTSGIATLLEALRIARNRRSRLCVNGLQGRVARLFDAAGLMNIFETSDCKSELKVS
jgi:anti-sigma B factor antagonist